MFHSLGPVASGSKPRSSRSGERVRKGQHGGVHSQVNEHNVRDLVEHFFSGAPRRATLLESVSLISPHLTISLPYDPIAPPDHYDLATPRPARFERSTSTSAKALALFHFPALAIASLPRSSWTLDIVSVSPLNSRATLEDAVPTLELDPSLAKVEVWTAELQWTLKFGSIATATGDGFDASSLSYRAGKPIGMSGGYDEWVWIGEKRKVELVFAEVETEGKKDVESPKRNRVGGKGKGKERMREPDAISRETRLVHIRLSLPPGTTTSADLLSLVVPEFLQPIVGFVMSHIVAPLFLSIAFAFLRFLHLDQASSRFHLSPRRELAPPRSHQPPMESKDAVDESSPKSPQRARSRTRRPLTGRLPSDPPMSVFPSDPTYVHVQVLASTPTRDEVEALEILRQRSSSPLPRGSPPSTTQTAQVRLPPPQSDVGASFSIVLLSIPVTLVSALVLETSDLYYLIKRIVVLFTQIVVASAGILRGILAGHSWFDEGKIAETDGIGRVDSEREREREGQVRGERVGRGRLSRISETEEDDEGVAGGGEEPEVVIETVEAEEEEHKVETAANNPARPPGIDREAIARGSPPLSPTPPVYHHPRLRGKRVQFPRLFATVIGGPSQSSPQVSLPPSPSHSPAPRPVPTTPPPSLSTSPEEPLVLPRDPPMSDDDDDVNDESSTDPRMYDSPHLANARSTQAVLHSRAAHEAAELGRSHRSSLSLSNHGVEVGEVGNTELKVWDEVTKDASAVGRSLREEVGMRIAVGDREDVLKQKREALIEENWDEEGGEEGQFEQGGVVELERKKLKNLVGKEAAKVAIDKMGDEGEREQQLEAIERRVEEKRDKMIEEVFEWELAAKEGSSSADYTTTPSFRRDDEPFPVEGAVPIECPSPSESTSSHSSSTAAEMALSPSITADRPSGATEAGTDSPPTSPEISKDPPPAVEYRSEDTATVRQGGKKPAESSTVTLAGDIKPEKSKAKSTSKSAAKRKKGTQ